MITDSVQQDMFTVLHGQPAPVVTRWTYRTGDPFAVTVAVRTRKDRWIDWLVGRELVLASLTGPAGDGDIRMCPREVHGYAVVEIEIRSVEGRAVLEVDRDLLQLFVDASLELVALGDEPLHMDLDLEIGKIVGSCAE
jgi:hypothetical protein